MIFNIDNYDLFFIQVCAAFAIYMTGAWKPFNKKSRLIVTLLLWAVVLGPGAADIVSDAYDSSLPQAPGEEINLEQYMPFGDFPDSKETLAKTLNGAPALKLRSDLPRLDGATALYPLYSAFVRATYPEGKYDPYSDLPAPGFDSGSENSVVVCTRTSNAFKNLIEGYADIVFLMGVSEEQMSEAKSRKLELKLTPIGSEAFIFFVNSLNTIEELSQDEIRKIYSGHIENWREVGGENAAIKAYQRPEGSGSQTALEKFMGDTPIAYAPREEVINTMSGMVGEVLNYRNYKSAMGYSFFYYVKDMINENKVKFISVDGIEPTRENIANGAYPLANNFFAITALRDGKYINAERTAAIEDLIDWILSPQGQYLVDATGYAALRY
jgi:phosphate transport system substrate-binding protein